MVAHSTYLAAAFLTANAIMAAQGLSDDAQVVLNALETTESKGWRVTVSTEWDVLGPFPIHAREQHFLSPSFPLNLTDSIDLSATYPSSYADGGIVGWTKARSDNDGLLEVAFPNIRWEALRATEGWAALQHHSVLRTTLTVHPPSQSHAAQHATNPRLSVNLLRGSFFTVLPGAGADVSVPEWHAGNIYELGSAVPNAVDLPSAPFLDRSTTYELVVSGDYEIRLFGDPRHSGSTVPKLSISLSVSVEDATHAILPVERIENHDVVCDFVDGWAFGDGLGIGLRSSNGWWTVNSIKTSVALAEGLDISLVEEASVVGPTQTRIIPLRLSQKKAVSLNSLDFTLTLKNGELQLEMLVTVPLQHRAKWSPTNVPDGGIKASYFYATSMPTAFLVVPPEEPYDNVPATPILALHGAGVDIFAGDFWIKALPHKRYSWTIAATGRTEWGLDWHGPSAREAFSAVDALTAILLARDEWRPYGLAPNTKVLLMGHSNGGQGAWYVSARHPDRVVGVIPAAGYIKSQSYVPWVQSRSAHYMDPAIRAILDSSLTPDDNDLFLSNLVDTPILAIHGGDDDNVPAWHTREAVSVVRTWNPRANITFREDPGKPHWYDNIFENDEVEHFVTQTLDQTASTVGQVSRSFTLTVASPRDSGSLHGWSILGLRIPGRLARLSVDMHSDAIKVRTTNVKAFSVILGSLPEDMQNVKFYVDGQIIELDEETWRLPHFPLCLVHEGHVWIPHALSSLATASPTGRVANFLSTSAPILIVVPSRSPSRLLSVAMRIAHNLNLYHKLDAQIMDDQQATDGLKDGSLSSGNIVILGNGELGDFAKSVLKHGKSAFTERGGSLELQNRALNDPSTATLFLHPHPMDVKGLVLFLYGADLDGLERGLRLFPIRTGVTVPDWIVVGPEADKMGAGGVKGAGVWGNDWSWNEAMSAF